MGALPRPSVPDGPVADYFARLHQLHHVAGWPSLRAMASEVGCSPTTVSAAFSGARLPRWGLLELLVETLGGDVEEFRRLWLAASEVAHDPRPHVSAAVTDVPRQLPADVASFTGRARELAAMDALLRGRDGARVALLCGTAGVGKTALAVHWAHRVCGRFPDGQVYLDLRGYDPGQPVSAGDALSTVLPALGVDPARLPADTAQRAARFRSAVAGRRMLLLFDNVASVNQVRELLPGTSSCLVLVTSRSQLPGLVARHDAVRVPLHPLPREDAADLLQNLLGPGVDEVALAAVAEACSQLPLALRIAAERVLSRPRLAVQDLVAELADRRLDVLTTGDDAFGDVRTVFSWSCDQLDADADRGFGLIGRWAPGEFDLDTAAVLLGVPDPSAATVLEALARAHLIEERAPGRFGMHDLLRAFAAERSASTPVADVEAARDRLLARHLEALADRGADWVATAWDSLCTTALAAAEERPDHLVQVASLVAQPLDASARFDAAEALHTAAVAAAQQLGDTGAEGRALLDLARVHLRVGRFHDAEREDTLALAACRSCADRIGEARALLGLGQLAWRHGSYAKAADLLTDACDLFRQTDDARGLGTASYNLGIAMRRLGNYAAAEKHHLEAIDVLAASGDRAAEARARNNLSLVRLFQWRYDEAVAELETALAIHMEHDDVVGQAVATDNLGTAAARQHDFRKARDLHQHALELYRDVGYRVGEGDALRGLGVALAGLGDTMLGEQRLREATGLGAELGEAEIETAARLDLADLLAQCGRGAESEEQAGAALALAELADDLYAQARARAALAELAWQSGDPDAAVTSWRRALDLFERLGLPDVGPIADRLAQAERSEDVP